MPRFVALDTQLVKDVEPILSEYGLELDTVIKMALKRIVRDKDIAFLTAKPQDPAVSISAPSQPFTTSSEPMTKNRAISMFDVQGFRISRNVTFASKNRSANNYWANPYFFALDSDWYLILNDWLKKELHLFIIPGKSIPHNAMIPRFDQPEKIDLQICFNDPTFTDTRSKVSFLKYLVKTTRY